MYKKRFPKNEWWASAMNSSLYKSVDFFEEDTSLIVTGTF
jgi:hypothetical protein